LFRFISSKFHLEVIRAYDRLATNGVAVHRNAAEDLLANPLKYFEAVFNEAKKLSEENKRLEEEKLVLQPKADTFDLVVAHKRVSVSAFCRTMQGVNLMKVKESLKKLGYLYRLGSYGNYRVYAKFQHYFEERLNAAREGSWELYPTEAGKSLLAKLYKDGKLQMKNS
jgi:phage antirepressor YoqD-like protein